MPTQQLIKCNTAYVTYQTMSSKNIFFENKSRSNKSLLVMPNCIHDKEFKVFKFKEFKLNVKVTKSTLL